MEPARATRWDARNAGKDGQLPPVAEEAPVTIVVNDREVATLLCTPRDLLEMTVGWLYAERLIEDTTEILSLAGCANDRTMLVSTEPDRVGVAEGPARLITSGCGAGANAALWQADNIPRVTGGLHLPLPTVRVMVRAVLRASRLYHLTGGVHTAALVDAERVVVQKEDIGRHNAVDKVIGHALLNGLPLDELALLATGRLSFEMAWKAARAGIPIVASLSIPSAMARDVAEAAGLTLVSRALSTRPWVYTHPERVRED
ncbi:MAG: formate dehydrogenase accessory sulfurtransferase FdhD [Dehalococcoidales bacterium]|nr:formate dehydrogenase accessory sulfurtransferase FdhD [Dehalococcoidales bacterium]